MGEGGNFQKNTCWEKNGVQGEALGEKNEGSNFYYPGPVFEILKTVAQPKGEK